MEIHARKMNVSGEVNYDELARGTDDFNAAQLRVGSIDSGCQQCSPRHMTSCDLASMICSV